MLTSKRLKSIKPVESITTGRLSRNTASSLAKKVAKEPKKSISKKPSINNMRRKSIIDSAKVLSSPEKPQPLGNCYKRLSEETLYDHNCEQTYKHICAGCDRNVIVQETSSSTTSSKQKIKSSSSSSTTATDIEDTPLTKKFAQRSKTEWWKESFLKQQEKLLATLLVNHRHMNDVELMSLQGQVIRLKEHTNTTLDHILDVQSKLLSKVTILLSFPSSTVQESTSEEVCTPPDWQTKIAFDITKFKWEMNQWFGNVVSTGEIDNQVYDRLGYTQDVTVSGIAVTTEPGLLPKSFQKYFQNKLSEIICLKYSFNLDRKIRLSDRFRYKGRDEWSDNDQCEFSLCEEDEYKHRKVKKQCLVKFGWFQRKHHCRCSNSLCLFFKNKGHEKGEWSRVCDGCFYERVRSSLSLS
ncbi:hypothetical protein BY458DRAFT_437639 [Sporodiniella umbellata]|nr:hypothetical protein BY458DRAFT_437639 [Sporodiniella umbellata]